MSAMALTSAAESLSLGRSPRMRRRLGDWNPMSSRIIRSGESHRNSAASWRSRSSSPLGPTKRNDARGRVGSGKPASPSPRAPPTTKRSADPARADEEGRTLTDSPSRSSRRRGQPVHGASVTSRCQSDAFETALLHITFGERRRCVASRKRRRVRARPCREDCGRLKGFAQSIFADTRDDDEVIHPSPPRPSAWRAATPSSSSVPRRRGGTWPSHRVRSFGRKRTILIRDRGFADQSQSPHRRAASSKSGAPRGCRVAARPPESVKVGTKHTRAAPIGRTSVARALRVGD